MRLAVIPARGGSKRIPKKNIRPFCGKPIIAYSIETSLQSGLFDHLIVSTDDAETVKIAKSLGAEVPFVRSAELSDDVTGTNEIVRDAILWFERQGEPVTIACCIYATAPFLDTKALRLGLETLERTGKSFAFSVTTFEFPIQRALLINAKNEIEAVSPEYSATRSQDLPERYHDAGQFYWGRASAFVDREVLYSTASAPVVIPRHLVQDIDTEADFRRAELMYRALRLEEG